MPNVGHLDGVAFADADHGWAVGGGWEHDITGSPTGPGVIVVTTDGGRTWSLQEVPDGTVPLTGVAFADQKRGWATGRNTNAAQCRSVFLATTDGGVTWVPRPVGTGPGCDLLDVAVVSNSRIVVVGWGTVRPPMVGAGVTAISDDGGITWQAITEMPDIFFWKVTVHDQHVWALGQTTEDGNYGGGVYRSDDGGLTGPSPERREGNP